MVPAAAADIATGGDRAEELEAVLVSVSSVTVSSVNPPARDGDSDPTNEYVVDGGLRVNDVLYATDPFPVPGDVLNISGVLRFAYADSKLEPRGPADVTFLSSAPPVLIGLGPSPVYLDVGDTDILSTPALIATLNRPAPSGGVSLNVDAPDPQLSITSPVFVPEGTTEVAIPMTGLGSADAASVHVTLDDVTLTAEVRVIGPAEVPTPVAADPNPLSVSIDAEVVALIGFDIPGRPGGNTMTVSVLPAGVIDVPGEIDLEAGEIVAELPVTGVAAGTATVTVSSSVGTLEIEVTTLDAPAVGLIITEVVYDVSGEDSGFEWVEIYNGSPGSVDLSGYSIAGGGTDYTWTQLQLSGTIDAGECWVVGGPNGNENNGNPAYDIAMDFSPDLQNSGSTADAVGLFDIPASDINGSSVPLDVVIYGSSNNSGLIDETGTARDPDVADANANSSLARQSDGWISTPTLTPGDCSHAF